MNKKNATKKKNEKPSQTLKEIIESIVNTLEIKPGGLYTPRELAVLFKLDSPTTILRAIRNNGLIASRHGRGYRILGKDALKYHKQMRVYRR